MARWRSARGCLGLVALALAVGACGGSASTGSGPATATTAATVTDAGPATASGTTATGTEATTSSRSAPPRPRGPSLVALGLAAGRLPQTDRLPTSDDPRLRAEMHALWRAVQSDSPAAGRGAFFPETAYAQVKAIADPAADFAGRLLVDYALDIAAAHALVGAGARLVGVQVPASYAHWIPPGVCDNRLGYYEVPNARVLYVSRGATRSFGIASMISWRGLWYVVHLGAVVRSVSGGVVDDPSAGPGTSAPSSTC